MTRLSARLAQADIKSAVNWPAGPAQTRGSPKTTPDVLPEVCSTETRRIRVPVIKFEFLISSRQVCQSM